MITETKEQRVYYFDFLRVAAALAVMVLHVSAVDWYDTDIFSFEWSVLNFYDAVVRWAVSVFTMISGALFLNKDIPLKKIYSKYIFRIFTAFVSWSAVYVCASYALNGSTLRAVDIFLKFLTGFYHMWFLFMIIGLYAIVPFVRKIAESKSLTKYFLVLAFVFVFLLPESVQIISMFSEKYGKFAGDWVNNFDMKFVAGFTGYFLLGYYLSSSEFSIKTERAVYLAGLLGFTATVMMSLYASRFKGEPFDFYYDHYTVNVLCEAAAVFVFFRKHFNFPSRIILKLSQYSFGAYLVHAEVIIVLSQLGLHSLTFNPVISIPVISLLVAVISFAVSAVLNHIPVINKYIV